MIRSNSSLVTILAASAIGCVMARTPDLGGSSNNNSNPDSGPSGGSQAVGGPCESDSNCAWIPGGAHCLTQAAAAGFGAGAPGGYCTSNSCNASSPATSCGPATICGALMQTGNATSFCEAACANQSECRTGFVCAMGGCVPGAPIPDSGMANENDSGMNENDSGMNENDSGMNENDSGMNENDSGMMVFNDAGMNHHDAGMTGHDAGMTMFNDAGMVCTGPTTISGTVHAPTLSTLETPDPINGAIVYVPTQSVAPFTPGAACEPCNAQLSGAPLTQMTTGPDGKFQLQVPAGSRIPLVVQIGRWRRQVVIPNVFACQDNALSDDLTRLPRTHAEGDIPLIAMVTGGGDSLECDLLKFGIDPGEFVDPGGSTGGRVEMYVNEGGDGGVPGSGIDTSTPSMATLVSNRTELMRYDMVIFGCPGVEQTQPPANELNLVAYANAGGRVLASHYSLAWLDNADAWETTGTWNPSATSPTATSATFSVDETSSDGQALASWLTGTGASTSPGEIVIQDYRTDMTAISSPAERLMYDSTQPLAYSFQTPWDDTGAQACGRVMYADFHTGLAGGTGGTCTTNAQCGTGGTCLFGICTTGSTTTTFPSECDPQAAMTPNEKALEFMLFNLGSCVNQ